MNNKNIFDLITVSVLLSFFAIACSISPWQPSNNTPPATPAPSASPSQSAADENDELREKIDELEKKIADQQKQKTTAPPVKQNVPIVKNPPNAARVSSPGDGFLALRSDPNSETGYRIVQIPHGATVRILGCQGFTQNVGGRTGRWCRIDYDGYTGWAFDGWLVY